ncbi:MAG: AAA family ATPase [Polyangiaceae bacterium]|nr:AAA family ATPase [Polyangiaceae bacterium]
MLERISIKHIPPFDDAEMDVAPRLNLITGDNGLGKTLLLDCVFFALTRSWPTTFDGIGVVPKSGDATIAWTMRDGAAAVSLDSHYRLGTASWLTPEAAAKTDFKPEDTPEAQTIVMYQRVDGGVSIMDPLRSFGPFEGLTASAITSDWFPVVLRSAFDQRRVIHFTESDIWNGLTLPHRKAPVCRGLITDVAEWAYNTRSSSFDYLAEVTKTLIGSEEKYQLVRNVDRVFLDDSRDYPILDGPGGEFSSAHAPAGLRRLLALAYLIVWAIKENSTHAALVNKPPANRFVLMVDEVESHLHPKWQRTILPSLLSSAGQDYDIQAIVTTHSPLVLASVEKLFDITRDAWCPLTINDKRVVLNNKPFLRLGEYGDWLTGGFGLRRARSLEAETVLDEVEREFGGAELDHQTAIMLYHKLHGVLSDIDPFWTRWRHIGKKQGWLRQDGRIASLTEGPK